MIVFEFYDFPFEKPPPSENRHWLRVQPSGDEHQPLFPGTLVGALIDALPLAKVDEIFALGFGTRPFLDDAA